MTITALACPATSADLAVYHPRILDTLSPNIADYSAQVTLAFNQVLTDLAGAGYEAALISNSAANVAAVKPLVCHKAFSIIVLDLIKENGDKWDMLYQAHRKEYLDALGNVKLEYDDDDSGSIDDEEKDFAARLQLSR